MSEEFRERPGQSWEEYWAVLARRRWLILLPLFLCWAAVWTISWLLPVEYQSEAVLGVDRQKVPEQYVAPETTFNLADWLQTATQQILTRPRLQQMIDEFQPSSGSSVAGLLLESADPVNRLRQDIQIEPIESPARPGSYNAFRILVTAESKEASREINEQVTSLFIAENTMGKRQRSEETSAFLNDELARAQEDVNAQEARITAFKRQHLGQLPSQLQSNAQILAGLQTELQSVQRALDSARQQKLYLDSLLQEYRSAQSDADAGSSNSPASQSLDKELMDLQLKLQSLRSKYTEDYPDIAMVKEAIAKTEELKKRLNSSAAGADSRDRAPRTESLESGSATDAHQDTPPSIMQAQSQLKANALEIQNDLQRERELESQVGVYQTRLNLAPETEQALDTLSSGYDETKKNYDSLLQKQMQSRLATSLEQGQGGEQMEILDPPSLPQRPSSPSRLRMSLAGLVLGLAVGLALTIFREISDARVQNDAELEEIVAAPVLAAIPPLSTRRENAVRRARAWMEVIVAAAIVSLVVAGNICSFYKG